MLTAEELKKIEKFTPAQIERSIARRSFADFISYTKKDYQFNWHHRLICETIEKFIVGEIKRLMIFTPPRFGKSEITSRRLPAFLLGANPDCRIIACSYGDTLASSMNRDVQRIIDSPEYAALFPASKLSGENVRADARGAYLRNNDIFEIVGRKGFYRSAGVGSGITGLGGDYLIIDDPVRNSADADSEVFRDKQWEWYLTTFKTRAEKDARILITMTRWHTDDLAGRLLQQQASEPLADKWTVISLPAIAERPASYDPRKEGEALWPDKYDRAYLERERATLMQSGGSRAWSALYQQNPIIVGGNLIKESWFKYLPMPPTHGGVKRKIWSWDLAAKTKEINDYTAGVLLWEFESGYYVRKLVLGKWEFPEAKRRIIAAYNEEPSGEVLIEDKSSGEGLIQVLKSETTLPIIAVPKSKDKVESVQAVLGIIESGRLYLPENADWLLSLLEQCAQFPNGKHDDIVDALTQALARTVNQWQVFAAVSGQSSQLPHENFQGGNDAPAEWER